MRADATELLVGLLQEFEQLGLAYAVGGSLASSMHGEPRTTHDADVLLDLPEARIPELVSRLEESFYVSEEAARRAASSASCFNLLHLDTGHKIDLFVAGSSPLDVLQLGTSQPSLLREDLAPVRVTSAPVLVLRKLLWFREGGEVSERQWRDVAGILRVQGPGLGLESVQAVAEELGLAELLARAVREAQAE